jgi:hypothetical protein
VAQGVGPEFKSQYHKKEKKKTQNQTTEVLKWWFLEAGVSTSLSGTYKKRTTSVSIPRPTEEPLTCFSVRNGVCSLVATQSSLGCSWATWQQVLGLCPWCLLLSTQSYLVAPVAAVAASPPGLCPLGQGAAPRHLWG